MAEITLRVGDQKVAINCAPHEQRRLGDLAALLESRLAVFAGEPEATRKLVLTALALMDEAQSAGAALARARAEIDRLNDLGCGDAEDAPVRPLASLPEGLA
ncbi:MAG: cell division protein ZapA [Hyphomonadaceae bacterium]|nr:cell division protein ZapA [Hyphomonadaceae bacterium]